MNWNVKTFFAGGIIASAGFLAAAEFEKGGETHDLQAYSDQAHPARQVKKNLFQDDSFKKSSSWIHSEDKALQKLRGNAIKQVVYTKKEGPEFSVENPLSLEELFGKSIDTFSSSWEYKLLKPSAGLYRVSLEARTYVKSKFGMRTILLMMFRSAENKWTSITVPLFSGSGTFQAYSKEFSIPEGAKEVNFLFRIYGGGEATFRGISLEKIEESKSAATMLDVTLNPASQMDRKFVLSQNDPALPQFHWKRNISKDQLNLVAPIFCLELPPGIKLCDTDVMSDFLGTESGIARVSLKRLVHRLKVMDDYDGYLSIGLMLETASAPGTVFPQSGFWIEENGKKLTERKVVQFEVIPQIPQTAPGRRFISGFEIMGRYMDFKNEAEKESLARFVGRTGSSWIAAKPDLDMTARYRKHGIQFITPELYGIADGFRINPTTMKKPDYAKYRFLGGENHPNLRHATCPAAIYNKTEFYSKGLVPYIQKELASYDGLIANWEPYMFHGKGCFCDVCRDEFAEFAGLSKEDVKKIWPQELLVNCKYHAQGVRFRSLQHAKLIKVIQEEVMKATTGKVGFVPQIVWIAHSTSPKRNHHTDEFDPLDYAQDFLYIDPWGPYIMWMPERPFLYRRGVNLCTYAAARSVVEFNQKNFKDGKRPKLVALPHAIQGFWPAQPEGIAMDVLSFFVAGYDASILYLFPRGYDARYWKAVADAHRQIAAHEDMVMGGQRVDGIFSVLPESPYSPPLTRVLAPLPDLPPQELLQLASFRQKDRYLAALGNFWSKGDVFARLKGKSLPENGKFMIIEKSRSRLYADNSKLYFTGSELAGQGVMLHVPAQRWSFFEFVPYVKDAEKGLEIIRPSMVKNGLENRRAALQAESAKEFANFRAEEKEYEQIKLETIRSGALTCSPGENGTVKFTSGKNSLVLGTAPWLVQSWKIDGKEVAGGTQMDGFGQACAWEPSVRLNGPFRLTEQKRLSNGAIQVRGERLLAKKDHPLLEHLFITQTLEVSEALDSIKITTKLENRHNPETGMLNISIGFRYHLAPHAFGHGGSIQIQANGAPVLLKRGANNSMLMKHDFAGLENLRKIYEIVDPTGKIDSGAFIFREKEGGAIRVVCEPADQFLGIASWNDAGQKNPSFEPCFERIKIPAAGSVQYSITFRQLKSGK